MRVIAQIGEWFDRRLQLAAPIREVAEHSVPRNTASWWYVFGSAALTIFLLQLVTGILLALIYVPSAAEAWNSLQALNHDVTLGWCIRALHGWGSNFMVAVVLIHIVQVFLFGAYKFPRELTWIVGVFLLLMTLGMAFSGQVLRFDQDAYWGLGIGASIASRVPILGPAIVKLMLGGPIIAGATLSRFFALHVFVIPGMLIGFVCVHLLMVVKLGVNEWPMPGRLVKRATYETEYHELTKKDGAPFVPYAVWKDLFFAAFILLAVAACAVYFGPFGPSGQPDPTIIQTAPKPDYFFLWLYALLSLLPPSMETPALLIGPVLVILGLLLLPFLSGEGEKSWWRRRWRWRGGVISSPGTGMARGISISGCGFLSADGSRSAGGGRHGLGLNLGFGLERGSRGPAGFPVFRHSLRDLLPLLGAHALSSPAATCARPIAQTCFQGGNYNIEPSFFFV